MDIAFIFIVAFTLANSSTYLYVYLYFLLFIEDKAKLRTKYT
jgi:hypothetical protein